MNHHYLFLLLCQSMGFRNEAIPDQPTTCEEWCSAEHRERFASSSKKAFVDALTKVKAHCPRGGPLKVLHLGVGLDSFDLPNAESKPGVRGAGVTKGADLNVDFFSTNKSPEDLLTTHEFVAEKQFDATLQTGSSVRAFDIAGIDNELLLTDQFSKVRRILHCFMRKLWWLEMVKFIEVLEDIGVLVFGM